MVKSKTGLAPCLVTNKKESQYACDDKCPQFKSIGVCSHVVAVAQTNDNLESFMKWYRSKSKRQVQTPNLMQLAKHDMPLGASRKGNRIPRKKVPWSKQVLTDENRVPLYMGTLKQLLIVTIQVNCRYQPHRLNTTYMLTDVSRQYHHRILFISSHHLLL